MLIEFTVENFRSFRDEQRFSFVATNATEHEETHVIQAPTGERLLRAAAVYGANASGKSNLLLALSAMRSVVVNSSRRTQGDRIEEVQPFRLDADSQRQTDDVRSRFSSPPTASAINTVSPPRPSASPPNGCTPSRKAAPNCGSHARTTPTNSATRFSGHKKVIEDATRHNASVFEHWSSVQRSTFDYWFDSSSKGA